MWVLSINGQAVAASKDEDALTQLYEDAVDSYRTDSVSTLKVLSAVQIRRFAFMAVIASRPYHTTGNSETRSVEQP